METVRDLLAYWLRIFFIKVTKWVVLQRRGFVSDEIDINFGAFSKVFHVAVPIWTKIDIYV